MDINSIGSSIQPGEQHTQPLNQVIQTQREQINALVIDKDAQEKILQKMYVKVQRLNEEIGLLSRALDIKMSDMATQMGQPVQKQDFVDIVAKLDTDGIRAYDASVYQTQITIMKGQLSRTTLECEDLRIVRQCNNQELIDLESKRHLLTLQVSEVQKAMKLL